MQTGIVNSKKICPNFTNRLNLNWQKLCLNLNALKHLLCGGTTKFWLSTLHVKLSFELGPIFSPPKLIVHSRSHSSVECQKRQCVGRNFENYMRSPTFIKGQLISESIFGFFESLKKATNFLTDFFPSFKGQKSVKNFVGFLGDLKTARFHSEITWPLLL